VLRATASSTLGRGLWLSMFAVAFGTNVPTALLLSYRGRLDLTPTMLTVVFAVYAVGLVPAPLLAGPASDRLGRRTLVLPFVGLAAVASVILVGAATSLSALLVGRLLQGAVSGVVFSVGSAWLVELVEDPSVASRWAATAMSLGFALGPLTAGVLGQYMPAPTTLPYAVHLVLMAGALVLVSRVRETVVRRTGRRPLLNLGVPRPARPAFLAFVMPIALWVFTFPSVSVTVLPLGLQEAMPGYELVVTGVVAGVTLGVGVLVQPIERRLGAVRSAPLAALAGAVGLGLGLLAIILELPLVLLPAAMLLGAGYGLGLAAGLTATQWLADPAHRGALVATFYALTYLGFGVPVVLSALSVDTDFVAALAGLSGLAVAAALWLKFGPGVRLVTERRDAR
jgi:predicted MFS family arabinose efflux permease